MKNTMKTNELKKYYASCLLSNQNRIDQSILDRTFTATFHLKTRGATRNASSYNNRYYSTAEKIMTPLYRNVIKSINEDNYIGRDVASVIMSMDVEATRINRRKLR